MLVDNVVSFLRAWIVALFSCLCAFLQVVEPRDRAATTPGGHARASELGCNGSNNVGGVVRGGTRYRSLFPVAETAVN